MYVLADTLRQIDAVMNGWQAMDALEQVCYIVLRLLLIVVWTQVLANQHTQFRVQVYRLRCQPQTGCFAQRFPLNLPIKTMAACVYAIQPYDERLIFGGDQNAGVTDPIVQMPAYLGGALQRS